MRIAHRLLIVSFTAFAVVGMFSLSLTGSRVARAQSGCTPPPSGMVAWWPGDGNAFDIQGGNNGTLQNGATFAAGKVGQGFSLDGVNDFVEIPHNSAFNVSSLTLDAWVNTDTLAGGSNGALIIISKYGFVAGSWYLDMLDGGRLDFAVYGSNNDVRFISTNNPVLVAGTWQHVAATFDLATQAMKIYVNGAEVPSTLGPGSTTIAGIRQTNSQVQIGSVNPNPAGNVGFWDGLIDEVEMFNRALTQSEIQAIFNADSAGKCKPACTPPPANMVSWWPGDGNALDIQVGNHGTLQNGAAFAIGKVGQSFSFNASANSGVIVPAAPSLNPTDAITLDAWVRPASYPNAAPAIMWKDTDVSGDHQYLLAIAYDGTTGVAHCNIRGVGSLVGGSVPLDVWSHVACTYDRQALRLFVNGIQVASASATQPIPTSSSNLAIGKEDLRTDRNFDGLIDEAELFNRALTPVEIQAIFNASINGKCKQVITPAGSNVVSQVNDASLTFPTASMQGVTTDFTIDPATAGTLPGGYTQTGLAYDISTTAAYTGPVNICFHLPAISDPNIFDRLKVLHNEGGTLVDRTTGKDFPSRFLCASVSSLSRFVIAQGATPTAIKLASFTATAYDDGQVLLEWKTGYEADNLGFNIYRDEAGRRTLVNPSLLAGSALLAGARTVLSAGQSYA
jgi:hypothetical protein